jgi:hypothetical protein
MPNFQADSDVPECLAVTRIDSVVRPTHNTCKAKFDIHFMWRVSQSFHSKNRLASHMAIRRRKKPSVCGTDNAPHNQINQMSQTLSKFNHPLVPKALTTDSRRFGPRSSHLVGLFRGLGI